jgi:hypothetical protein
VITGSIESSGKGSSPIPTELILREHGDIEECDKMFRKHMFHISDDSARFSYAYISFLTEVGTLEKLNKAFSSIRNVFKMHVSPIQKHLTIQGMSGVPQTTAVADNTTMDTEPSPTVASVSENKRKFSVSEDVGTSKKIKTTAAEETVSHRYLARFC